MNARRVRAAVVLLASLVVLAVSNGCARTPTVPSGVQPAAPIAGESSKSVPATRPAPAAASLATLRLGLQRAWTGFNAPLYLTNAGDGSARLFVVEQGGLIKVIDKGRVLSRPYLDLRSQTVVASERGLLGMAFSPRFRTDGKVYVDYTDRTGNTVIARYTADDPASSAPGWSSPDRLLYIQQPFANHNGGCLQFGPDGFLYIGMGDGGSAGDPGNRAQSPGVLLGKILRIDVSKAGPTTPYAIPPTNPSKLTKNAVLRPAPEVWAIGLRNPWRFSFDPNDGSLWIADVGQDAWEEVDHVTSSEEAAGARKGGLNFGWHVYEGLHAYPSGVTVTSKDPAYVWPVLDYPHPTGDSITGGYIYRGADYPALVGTYLYADYVRGWIGGIRLEAPDGSRLASPETKTLMKTRYNPSSFGLDERRELYLVDYGGQVFRVTGAAK